MEPNALLIIMKGQMSRQEQTFFLEQIRSPSQSHLVVPESLPHNIVLYISRTHQLARF